MRQWGMGMLALLQLIDAWRSLPVKLSSTEQEKVIAGQTSVVLVDTGGSVKSAYAVAIAACSATDLASAARDYEHYSEFMPYIDQASVVRSEGGALLSYQHVDLPWPISDRWYRVSVTPMRLSGGDVLSYSWTYVSGSGNIVDTRGSWTFLRLAGNRTLMCYFVSADLGIPLPGWILNLASRHALPDVIRAVRARARC